MAAADYASVAQQLYVAYFGRPADPTGLANVEAALLAAGAPTDAAGLSAAYSTNAGVKSLIDSFGSSAESAALYTGTTTQFVNAIYHDLFNRGADVAGLTFWVNAIDSGSLTMAHAAQSILAGAAPADAATIAAKVTAAGNFTTALNTGDALAAYSGNTAAADARAMLTNVDSTTDQVAFEATITATINTIVQGPSTTTALTAGVDTLVGGTGNDVFTGAITASTTTTTWNALDSIDGGKGVNTLNLTDTVADGATVPNPLDLTLGTVKNIQILNATTVGSLIGNAADVSGWTGLTNANFVLKSTAIQTITAADTTAVSVIDSTAGTIVNGGSTVNVTANAVNGAIAVANTAAVKAGLTALDANVNTAATVIAETGLTAAAVTAGFITAAQQSAIDTAYSTGFVTSAAAAEAAAKAVVDGYLATATTAAASAVTAAPLNDVTISGEALTSATVTGGNVITINDQGNATLTSVTLTGAQGAATLTSDSLTNVSLSSTSAAVAIVNTTAKHALTLGVNAVSSTITDTAAGTVALNVTGATAKTASTITLVTGATEIDVNTAAKLTLTATDATLATITVAGAGSFNTNVSGSTTVTSINASAQTGASTVTLSDTVTAFTGGAGNDTVHISNTGVPAAGATFQAIDGGAGTNAIGFADGAFLTTGDAGNFTNFQILDATNGTGTYNAAYITGITTVQAGVVTGAVTFDVAAGTDLNLLAAGSGTVAYALATNTATDAVTVHLGTAAATGIAFGSELTVGAIESLTIDSLGAVSDVDGSSVGVNSINLLDSSATSLTVTGTESLTITGLTALKTIDTTALVAGTAVTIGVAASGLAYASETISTGGVTVTDGDSNLTFYGDAAASKVDTIVAGNGTNTIIESGAGNSSITVGTGVNHIYVGDTPAILGGSAAVAGSSGQDTITLGAHTKADDIHIGTVASANAYSSITGAVHGDTIDLDILDTHIGAFSAPVGTVTATAATAQITLNAGTAAFADYVLAATSTNTAGSGAGQISWFVFGNNTYIVEDNSSLNGFQAGTDNIVQLTGVVNLAATGSAAHIVAGHVVL